MKKKPETSQNLLKDAQAQLESQLTPENRKNYDRIVEAGMRAALEKGGGGILASLKDSQDPVRDCAVGAINLCFLLYRQSRGTMPVMALVPAAMTLMLEALDFAGHAGIITVDKGVIAQATRIFTDTILERLGVSKEMLQTAASRTQGMTKDPAKLEAIKRAAGAAKDPRASEPTILPTEVADGAA